MMTLPPQAACLIFSALALLPASAELKLARIFGSGMVVQQQKPTVIWGWDAPGTEVKVTFADQTGTTKVDARGEWRLNLPGAIEDGRKLTLTATGTTSVTLDNVLLGEVWLAGGQSNMDWALGDSTGGKAEIAAANFPEIRTFHVGKDISPKRKQDLAKGEWKICSPATIGKFSAVAYFFGKDLHGNLKVPVGLVMSTVSGTPIEPWMSPESYATLPPPPPAPPDARKMWPSPSNLYEGMIQPLSPFALRGVIWYQGEGNSRDGALYTAKMKALIGGWRKTWGDEFPFYFVQIGQRPYPPELTWPKPDTLPKFWEAQSVAADTTAGSAMAVINDISELDLHPRNKKDVGHRLALIALANTYGHEDIVWSGPVFKSMTIEGDRLRISFSHVGGGLASRDGAELSCFEVIGTGQSDFVPAKAVIEGKGVVVSASGVAKPIAVRFVWNNTAVPNLMNKEGLPARSFRAGDIPGTGDSR